MPGVHSPSLPTLLLLEELTDVLGGHDLSPADSSGHDLHSDRRSLGWERVGSDSPFPRRQSPAGSPSVRSSGHCILDTHSVVVQAGVKVWLCSLALAARLTVNDFQLLHPVEVVERRHERVVTPAPLSALLTALALCLIGEHSVRLVR